MFRKLAWLGDEDLKNRFTWHGMAWPGPALPLPWPGLALAGASRHGKCFDLNIFIFF
jgi:hypothetical protein